jgi:uncharacterized membrane protein HdeD (DUF308 family)
MAENMSLKAASEAMREAMRQAVIRYRFWYIVQGVLMVLGGAVVILYPLYSSAALVVFIGWVLIITGVFQGITLIGAKDVPHFWLQFISLALAVIVGVLFVRNPAAGIGTLILLMIVFFMVEGISKVVFSLTIRPLPNWGWVFASGIVGIILAAYLLTNPGIAVWLLGVLIGIQLISGGFALGYMGWSVRD